MRLDLQLSGRNRTNHMQLFRVFQIENGFLENSIAMSMVQKYLVFQWSWFSSGCIMWSGVAFHHRANADLTAQCNVCNLEVASFLFFNHKTLQQLQ